MSTAPCAPDFLVLGAARAATTMLARVLGQHRGVAITDPKEPHFFAFHTPGAAFTGPGDDTSINNAVTDPDRYAEIIAAARCTGATVGDCSVSSLYYHEHSIPTLSHYAPGAHLVAVLRDPADRAFSAYQYLRSRGLESENDFATAIDAEPQRIDAGWHHMWHYQAMGRYADQITAFHDAFGADRVQVMLYEDLIADPALAAAAILSAMDVAVEPIGIAVGDAVNRSGEPRNAAVAAMSRAFYNSERVRVIATRVLPAAVRDRLRSASLQRSALDPIVRAQLIDGFADDIGRLEDLLARDLSQWRTP